MRELHVGAADDLNSFDNVVGIFLQALLQLFGNGQHRRGAVRVAGMDAHCINIFNKTDGDHVVFGVTDNFQLQLFPADHGFFNQDLADETCRNAPAGDNAQLFQIINDAAASAAHGIGRPDDHRITKLGRNFFRLFDRNSRFAFGHFNAELVHSFFKSDPVFAPFNGIHLNTDHLHMVLLQNTQLV